MLHVHLYKFVLEDIKLPKTLSIGYKKKEKRSQYFTKSKFEYATRVTKENRIAELLEKCEVGEKFAEQGFRKFLTKVVIDR